jgi:small subunit ribosomal protein S6
MADEIELKVYELAYHLTPELEEADVKARAQELVNLITQNSGSVLISKEPKRSHLSYPIRHKQYSYLGVLEFKAPAEAVEKINAQIKLQNDVLRFLLLKKPGNGALRTLGEPRAERMRMRTQESTMAKIRPSAPVSEQETKAESKIKTEEIEKEIEEVIKGL